MAGIYRLQLVCYLSLSFPRFITFIEQSNSQVNILTLPPTSWHSHAHEQKVSVRSIYCSFCMLTYLVLHACHMIGMSKFFAPQIKFVSLALEVVDKDCIIS